MVHSIGGKKGSSAKIKSSAFFVDYRENSSFPFSKHLLSTYYVKGTVSGAGKMIKITLLLLQGAYDLVGKMRHRSVINCDRCNEKSLRCLKLSEEREELPSCGD